MNRVNVQIQWANLTFPSDGNQELVVHAFVHQARAKLCAMIRRILQPLIAEASLHADTQVDIFPDGNIVLRNIEYNAAKTVEGWLIRQEDLLACFIIPKDLTVPVSPKGQPVVTHSLSSFLQ